MKNKRDYKKDPSVIMLKEEFVKIFSKYTSAINVEKCWRQVLRCYTGKNRYYHNIDHIVNMVNLWKKYNTLLSKPDEIFIAIIYHDIVYNVRSKSSNEDSSAELFFVVWHSFDWDKFDKERMSFVESAIKLTKHNPLHTSILTHEDIKMFLDFDLSVLSSDEKEYNKYRLSIRKEYSHFPLKKYKAGRKFVLERFLSRPEIFLTQTFKINEKRARKNLRNEIKLYLCDNKK